jgi:hypothetical protein
MAQAACKAIYVAIGHDNGYAVRRKSVSCQLIAALLVQHTLDELHTQYGKLDKLIMIRTAAPSS